MKIRKHQKHGPYKNTTTIVLDGVHEANALVRKAITHQDKWFPKNFDDIIGIKRANKHYKAEFEDWYADDDYNASSFIKQLEKCLEQIEKGNPALDKEIFALADQFVEAAKAIEPSLTQEVAWKPADEGDLWAADKIAEGGPLSFFDRQKEMQPKQGKGDGAFRIVINTDVGWWADPKHQCAAIMALVLLLQRSAPVEIWIQQGWVGDGPEDGITLFKIFEGAKLTPQHIYFWIASNLKDTPYSWTVNKMLMRNDTAVSGPSELPCDLYIYGSFMPHLTNVEQFSEWVAKTARPMLFEEEMPDNWCGYGTKLASLKEWESEIE